MSNKTSEAVQEALDWDAKGIDPGWTSQMLVKTCKKYQRMESALQEIAVGRTSCEDYNVRQDCEVVAKEALNYDPLGG